MQILWRNHPRQIRAICTYAMVVVAALLFSISQAHAQQAENVYQNGFEPFVPSYSYAWQTDQFVVAQVGRTYEFEVRVQDSVGTPITSGDVTWTSENPAVATLTVLSPRRVRVQVTSTPGPGVVRIAAKHPDTQVVSNAQLIFETLQPRSRFVSGASLVSATTTQAIFLANTETNPIIAGDIVMVGDSKALLVRINSIANVGAQRVAQTTPAFVSEYFVENAPPVIIESEPLRMRIDVRDGQVSYLDASNRILSRTPLQPEAVSCETSGGGSVTVDASKIVIDGAGANFSTWRLNYDWRNLALSVTGDWVAQVTVQPGALSINGNVGFKCSLALPAVPVPLAGFTLYAAKIGLTVAPTLFLESEVSVATSLLQNIELYGRTSGQLTTGLRWALFGGWTAFGSINNAKATTEVRRVGSTFSTTTTNVNIKSYLRAEPEFGVSGASFDTFTTRFSEVDLGARMALQTQTPLNPQLFNYVGPSGDVSGLARAKLKAPQLLNQLIDIVRRALPGVDPPPTNLQLQLFDTEPVKLNWDAANLIVSPSQVTQACSTPNVQFLVSNLRENASLLAAAFARGKYRIHLYAVGNDIAPVWISPEQNFSFGSSQYSVPISQIRDTSGNAITGDLRAQVRASYAIAPLGDLQEPVSALLPVRSTSVQTLRINPATLNCGQPGILNDTGIDWCANNTTNNLSCPQAGFPDQDGDHGRDARARTGQLTKIGGGEAGFDYTKISNSGNPLPAGAVLGTGANDWGCTRDNVSGLIWEVKLNNAASLRHMNHTYTWYDTNSAINGGNAGTIGTAATCNSTLTQCNTSAFVVAVNAQGLCGANNWRMPTPEELQGIVHYGRFNPSIDPGYFPNTSISFNAIVVWSGGNYAAFASNAWNVGNDNGVGYSKSVDYGVRLVRGGQ